MTCVVLSSRIFGSSVIDLIVVVEVLTLESVVTSGASVKTSYIMNGCTGSGRPST